MPHVICPGSLGVPASSLTPGVRSSCPWLWAAQLDSLDRAQVSTTVLLPPRLPTLPGCPQHLAGHPLPGLPPELPAGASEERSGPSLTPSLLPPQPGAASGLGEASPVTSRGHFLVTSPSSPPPGAPLPPHRPPALLCCLRCPQGFEWLQGKAHILVRSPPAGALCFVWILHLDTCARPQAALGGCCPHPSEPWGGPDRVRESQGRSQGVRTLA